MSEPAALDLADIRETMAASLVASRELVLALVDEVESRRAERDALVAIQKKALDALTELLPRQLQWSSCSTPYCSGAHAEVEVFDGDLIVKYQCQCGSEDGWDPLAAALGEVTQ